MRRPGSPQIGCLRAETQVAELYWSQGADARSRSDLQEISGGWAGTGGVLPCHGAAPCALFALGVTVALRPLDRVPWEVPILCVMKLMVQPAMVLVMLSLLGPFEETWIATAVLIFIILL